MGEFAKNYITDLIEEVNKLGNDIAQEEFNRFLNKVKIIDEPFIKYKLIEMLDSKLSMTEDVRLQKLIEKKTKEIENLKNKRSNDKNRTS